MHGYDAAGALNSIVYSDATGTPTVTTSYDRLGRPPGKVLLPDATD